MRNLRRAYEGSQGIEVGGISPENLVWIFGSARFPAVADKGGYLVIKEPHGAQGAPLLMEALPESRMIFLILDPRDVVASKMDLAREDSRVRESAKKRGQERKKSLPTNGRTLS